MEKDNEWTVVQIIRQVSQQICDHYCRYPDICTSEEELQKQCDNCPLNRLEDM